MKKFYSLPGIGLAIVFLIVSYIFISKSIDESKQFRVEKHKVAEVLNFNDRLLSFREWVFTKKTWDEKKVKLDTIMSDADKHYVNAKEYGNYILYTALAFFIIIVAFYAKTRIYFGLTFALSFIALVLLGQGVMTPMLEISAFKEELTIKVHVHPDDIPYFDEAVAYIGEVNAYMGDVKNAINLVRIVSNSAADKLQGIVGEAETYLSEGEAYLGEHKDTPIGFDKVFPGRTYFMYQNKGIMDVVKLLWNKNNKPVAISIAVFSVIIPAIKLISTLIILLLSITGANRFRKFLSYIAKFSMADVFVIGAFLSYLSFSNMNSGVQSDAKVLFGLYYFMGYVLISLVLGILLDRSIKEVIKISEREDLLNSDLDTEEISNEYTEGNN